MKQVAASVLGAVLALVLASAALADWDDPVKWDQLERDAFHGARSFVTDTDWALAADDFRCNETGWITDIEFNGYPDTSAAGLSSFRITFWSDVPATPNEASHPGDEPLATIDVGPVDPADPLGLGWQDIENFTYKINLAEADWFFQQEGCVYWIGIQGIVDDGFKFTWQLRDRNADMWGDDAVFATPNYTPWWHWGWPDASEIGWADVYQGTLPDDWDKSADMSFRLTGIPIPEPATLGLVALGIFALLARRRR